MAKKQGKRRMMRETKSGIIRYVEAKTKEEPSRKKKQQKNG